MRDKLWIRVIIDLSTRSEFLSCISLPPVSPFFIQGLIWLAWDVAAFQGSCDGRAKLFANEEVVFLQKKLESVHPLESVLLPQSSLPWWGRPLLVTPVLPVSSFNPSLNLSFFTTTYSHLVTQRPIYLKMYSLTTKEWWNRKQLLLMLLLPMLGLMLILLFPPTPFFSGGWQGLLPLILSIQSLQHPYEDVDQARVAEFHNSMAPPWRPDALGWRGWPRRGTVTGPGACLDSTRFTAPQRSQVNVPCGFQAW